jgi:Helicase conserved C-terminal domain
MRSLKRPGKAVVIPAPILRLLPPVTLTLATVPEPPFIRSGSPDALLRDLVTVLSALRREPIELTTRGLIPKRFLVKLARLVSVGESDLDYPTFLTAIARDVGLIVAAGGRLTEGRHTASFLERPRGKRLRQLYEAYVGNERWSELTRIPNVPVRGTTEGPHIVKARQRVLNVLGQCPRARWVEINHVIDLIRRTSYEFLIPRERNDPYGWYAGYTFNPYTDGNLLGVSFSEPWDEGEGWNRVEGGFVRAVVIEPLFWLGMVDLGAASPDDDPHVLLLNETGVSLLQGRTPELQPPATHVVVQPNFQVFVFEPTGEDVVFGLDRLAERVSMQQAIEYRITRDSIYQAQQSGMHVTEILSFLEGVSTVPIPQNVRRSIEEWAALNDRVVIRRGASLVQTIDGATMDALYSRSDIAPLLGRRLTPTAALVPSKNLVALNTRLADGTGPMPVLSEGNDAQLGDAIQVGDDGTITFRERLPSVYVQRQVFAVAEPDGDGTYRLTRDSLRRAARNLGPDAIIDALSHLQGYPLSDHVAALIQSWTKDWGGAALAEVLLLQVDSTEILEALLGTPELRPHLQRLQGAATCALVRPEGVDAVRAALQERGMELRTDPTTVQKR